MATGSPSIFTRTFFSVAPGVDAEVRRQRLDGGRVRGVDLLHLRAVPRRRRLGRRERDRLDVGRVPATRAGDEGVFPDRGRREELLRRGTAHRSRHRRDDAVVQAQPVEDADVGLTMQLVGLGEPVVVEVERVGVLHDEFAPAQDAGAGPCLVAILGRDLVQHDRQILVGAVLALHQQREELLVGGPEQVVAALAVLQPEEQIAVLVPAAGGERRAPSAAAPGAGPPGRRCDPSPRARRSPPGRARSCRAAASSRCPDATRRT